MINEINSLGADFQTKLKKYISDNKLGHKFDIIRDPSLEDFTSIQNLNVGKPDFLILKGNHPFMIVEIVKDIKVNRFVRNSRQSIIVQLNVTEADYYVITDLKNCIVHRVNQDSIVVEFENIFNFFGELNIEEIINIKKKIKRTIIAIINNSKINDKYSENTSIELSKLFTDFDPLELIQYNQLGRFFHFASHSDFKLNDFENVFFQALLKKVKDKVICRYTSLNSAFLMIDKRNYRMASNIAMNDRGEIDYVDKYLQIFYKPLNRLSLDEMKVLNTNFISSCTTRRNIDDLTMYRLYGDESKGVCLCYNVKNEVQDSNLILKEVSYARGVNDHPELELIKEIVSVISRDLNVRFRFQNIDIWKHFFKSYHFSIEKEIRLLYVSNNNQLSLDDGWVLTDSDKIASKYVNFELNNDDFPVRLSKIILGPNCPEKDLNKRQFEVMIEEKGLNKITVELSKIDSYRK